MSNPKTVKDLADEFAHEFYALAQLGLDDDWREDIEIYDLIVDAFKEGYLYGAGEKTAEDLKSEIDELRGDEEDAD
jgi:hypothetical protein